MKTNFLEVQNGVAGPLDRIPNLSFDDFRAGALEIVENGGKAVQYFAYEESGSVRLMAVLRADARLFAAACDAPDVYPALTRELEQFHMFEREIAEQFGIKPENHPWLKMVRYHPNFTGKEDVFGNSYDEDIPGNYDYYSVKGEDVHEVAVGPVHAGVIEPGHFRFNCVGERVLHLEIQLGYQHRGIEQLFLNADPGRFPVFAENIAGDTTIGHALCFAQAAESLSRLSPDPGARIIRTIALELERLANHIGDLGALSGDVAFLPPANYFGRIRGDFLNMSLLISGNRFGKGIVRPGGVRFPLDDKKRDELKKRIDDLEPQVRNVLDLLFSTSSVRARFEECGIVSREDAEKLGLVGPSGRASGIAYDARRLFPTEHYPELDIPENAEESGDVYARAKVRSDEIIQSIKIVRSLLKETVETDCVPETNFKMAPSSFVVAVNEGWRGELSHCALTDASGGFVRYKIKDPSFHNWNGLAMALRDTEISDFPLNNKSYNLSYCGFDL